MIVAVSGMYRSGSTFSFNIVREILSSFGSVVTLSDNSLPNLLVSEEYLIIKTHAPDFQLSGMIYERKIPCVCTYRKPEDAIASWMRVFGGTLESAITLIESWCKWHSEVHNHVLNISYEQIEYNSFGAILTIQRYLTGMEDIAQVTMLNMKYQKSIMKDYTDMLQQSDDTTDLGFTYYDNETFFHRKHISSLKSISATEVFSESQILSIRGQLDRFVHADGRYKFLDCSAT